MSAEITMTPETIKVPGEESKRPKGAKKSLWTVGIVAGALRDSLLKLNPRTLMKNPVMFVVEVGAVITTVELVNHIVRHMAGLGFELQITLWLWLRYCLRILPRRWRRVAARLRLRRCAKRAQKRTPGE